MGFSGVKEYFCRHGMEDKVLEFAVSSATVDLAAKEAGCEPARTIFIFAMRTIRCIVLDTHRYLHSDAFKSTHLFSLTT